jgi:hypothetical protein
MMEITAASTGSTYMTILSRPSTTTRCVPQPSPAGLPGSGGRAAGTITA